MKYSIFFITIVLLENITFAMGSNRVVEAVNNNLSSSDSNNVSKIEVNISAGEFHTCAIDEYGVKCWGLDDSGQSSKIPKLNNPIQISVGWYHSCALDDDGVKCWGNDEYGQVSKIPKLNHPIQISSAHNRTCALDAEGVKCWGVNWVSIFDRLFTKIPILNNPKQISTSGTHFCAIDDDGVKCGGKDDYGQSSKIPKLNHPIQITTGDRHTCALDADGVKCWGANYFGQVLSNSKLNHPKLVSAGGWHTCVLDADGVRCGGLDDFGQSSKIPKLNPPIQIATGPHNSCAYNVNGVKCWGKDDYGQSSKVPELISIIKPNFKNYSRAQQFLQKLSGFLYHFDQKYTIAAANIFEKNISNELIKYFVITSLLPNFQNFGYPGVKEKYLDQAIERIISENSKLGIYSINDIKKTNETISAALQMLLVSLKTSISLLSTEDKKTSESFIAEIGKLVSGELKFSDVLKFIENNGSKLEQHIIKLSQNDYLTGREATDMLILNYLRGL